MRCLCHSSSGARQQGLVAGASASHPGGRTFTPDPREVSRSPGSGCVGPVLNPAPSVCALRWTPGAEARRPFSPGPAYTGQGPRSCAAAQEMEGQYPPQMPMALRDPPASGGACHGGLLGSEREKGLLPLCPAECCPLLGCSEPAIAPAQLGACSEDPSSRPICAVRAQHGGRPEGASRSPSVCTQGADPQDPRPNGWNGALLLHSPL